ncbi:dihydrofolate reductase [Ideonella dechloratans]|uniref:dihydrofolate reductase n=1 Tax=Ideonella dechloratans TaxID=36863 RepID=UPI0035B16D3E
MIRPTVLVLIAAVARNGVIGRDNQLLWHLPEDMAHFRETTRGAPVIMGRKTWESLPARFRPLPGRRNIVLSRQPGYAAEGAEVVATLDDAMLRLQASPQAFVIGGEQLYRLALPRADQLVLTELDRDYEGDARFPAWDPSSFVEVERRPAQSAPADGPGYTFVTYQRRPGA